MQCHSIYVFHDKVRVISHTIRNKYPVVLMLDFGLTFITCNAFYRCKLGGYIKTVKSVHVGLTYYASLKYGTVPQ